MFTLDNTSNISKLNLNNMNLMLKSIMLENPDMELSNACDIVNDTYVYKMQWTAGLNRNKDLDSEIFDTYSDAQDFVVCELKLLLEDLDDLDAADWETKFEATFIEKQIIDLRSNKENTITSDCAGYYYYINAY